MVVFSSSESFIVPDVFLHLFPHVKLQRHEAMPDATAPSANLPNAFRIRTADELQALISATTTLHFSSHAARRADLTDPVQMDLHFRLFSTPYCGFVPEDMTDMHIELFQLASHLIRSTPPLLDVWDGTALPSPSSLLATLCVYLNPGLLPPPLPPPGDLAISLKPATHPLPNHFQEDLLAFEHWPPADTLLTFDDPDPPEPLPILSISCPESQTMLPRTMGSHSATALSHFSSILARAWPGQYRWAEDNPDTSGYTGRGNTVIP